MTKPYSPVTGTVFWRPDPEVELLRKSQHWKDFHKEAGKRGLYFDNVKQGNATAFTLKKTQQGGWMAIHLCDVKAKTSLAAMEQCYRQSGRCDAELDRIMDRLCGRVPVDDDFSALFD
jgi:hypothetical protein